MCIVKEEKISQILIDIVFDVFVNSSNLPPQKRTCSLIQKNHQKSAYRFLLIANYVTKLAFLFY